MKKFTRTREVKNLHKCNSILIIGSDKEDVNGDEISRLMKYLKQLDKEVFSLFYIKKQKDKETTQYPDIKTFNDDDLNKLFKPKNQDVLLLIDREFDLLIDLTIKEIFPLKYIHAMSKARFKVGAAMNYKRNFGDLTIEIENNPTIEYLITQIKHYLTQINRDQNVA